MSYIRKIIVFFVPTFLLVSSSLWAGYASMYSAEFMYQYDSSEAVIVGPRLGFQQLYSKHSYRAFYFSYFPYVNHSVTTADFEYAWIKPFSSDYKFLSSIVWRNGVSDSSLLSQLYSSFTVLQRVSDRHMLRYSVGVPVVNVVGDYTSFWISFGFHYFHGKGLKIQESSKELKGIKRRFLWFFWI